MRNKKAKALRRISYSLWFNSDRSVDKKTIYKNMKKTYKENKGEL